MFQWLQLQCLVSSVILSQLASRTLGWSACVRTPPGDICHETSWHCPLHFHTPCAMYVFKWQLNCFKYLQCFVPSVLWRCWLGSRKGTRPVKNWVVGCWRGYLSTERRADLHMAKLMPLPLTVSCFSKIQIGFTFLVLAYPGSPRQRAVKWVCVCVPSAVAWLDSVHRPLLSEVIALVTSELAPECKLTGQRDA